MKRNHHLVIHLASSLNLVSMNSQYTHQILTEIEVYRTFLSNFIDSHIRKNSIQCRRRSVRVAAVNNCELGSEQYKIEIRLRRGIGPTIRLDEGLAAHRCIRSFEKKRFRVSHVCTAQSGKYISHIFWLGEHIIQNTHRKGTRCIGTSVLSGMAAY